MRTVFLRPAAASEEALLLDYLPNLELPGAYSKVRKLFKFVVISVFINQ